MKEGNEYALTQAINEVMELAIQVARKHTVAPMQLLLYGAAHMSRLETGSTFGDAAALFSKAWNNLQKAQADIQSDTGTAH